MAPREARRRMEKETVLKERIQKALNEQINAELYSSYLYLAMSAYFGSINLKGFANWMRIQAQEELAHTMKFYDFIEERGGRASLTSIEGPRTEWSSPLEAFEHAYEHETHVTALINALVDVSIEESDHATNNFLQWFVAEQVEEESSADDIVQRLKLVGNDGAGLFMIDQELAARTFVMPV